MEQEELPQLADALVAASRKILNRLKRAVIPMYYPFYKNAMILNFGLVAFRNHGTTRLFPRAEAAFDVGDVF